MSLSQISILAESIINSSPFKKFWLHMVLYLARIFIDDRFPYEVSIAKMRFILTELSFFVRGEVF